MNNAGTVRRAALVRAAVRAAARDGALGELPAGLKIGVRSGVDTIAIELDDAPADWTITAEPAGNTPFPDRAGSAAACELAGKLISIARQHAPGRPAYVLLGTPNGDGIRIATGATTTQQALSGPAVPN